MKYEKINENKTQKRQPKNEQTFDDIRVFSISFSQYNFFVQDWLHVTQNTIQLN